MTQDITVSLFIQAGPDKVYRALTASDKVSQWFSEHADINLDEQRYDFRGRYTPEAPDREAGKHKLTHVELNRSIAFDWRMYDCDTRVRIELKPEGTGTQLDLSHEALPDRIEGEVSLSDYWLVVLENMRALLEERESGPRYDFSRKVYGDVTLAFEIAAPPDVVFKELMEPQELDRYIADGAVVEPHVGGRYNYNWGEDGGPMKILELVPDEKLAFSWRFEGEPQTVVTWSLEGTGNRTRMTLVHSGFADTTNTEDYSLGWLLFASRIKFLAEANATWQKPSKTFHDYVAA